MMRLFTPSLPTKYEELYHKNGVKFVKGVKIRSLEAGSDGRVAAVILENGSSIEADIIVIGMGAKPAVGLFERIGLNKTIGGIQ
ncbi:Monodehydroascorbate reductase, chloroplastic/mitochondrial, partial [Ancistrocladus abbreviatus]